MPPPLTRSALELQLRRLMESDRIELQVAPLKDQDGWIDFDRPKACVTIDPFCCGYLPVLIHELIHYARYHSLEAWGDMEETIVLAVEDDIVRYINRSQLRRNWWRKRLVDYLDIYHAQED